uniref:NADH-ubiquinone oxidoreductase chain 6 n=1 Tax=Lysmata sp. 1 LQZ-2020 TaxID=2735370 RepID=A0A8X8M186_9EUCA|nr:NADH dehydrogenase subunit 6 [Lysmata sp. 1 LQZ-2020]
MLINFMILTLTMTLLFTQMQTPLAMGLILLIQTLLVCGTAGILTKSTWFSYILFLIFLGAMLVLFIYVASLASNEQFSLPSLSTMSLFTFIPSILAVSSFFLDPMLLFQSISMEISSLSLQELLSSTPFNVSVIYSPTSMNLTIFIILYLLLTLVIVVKITESFWGPLRLS